MKTLEEHIKSGHNLGYYLKSAWYFETPLEKLILIAIGIMGIWKIIEFFL